MYKEKKFVLVGMLILLLSSAQYAQGGLNDGLIAYYPFSGNANDVTTNGYHGTVFGAELTTDRFGNPDSAYSFDASPELIQLPHQILDGRTDFTYSAWLNFTTDNIDPTMFSAASLSTPNEAVLWCRDEIFRFYVYDSHRATYSHSYTYDEWIFLTLVRHGDTGVTKLYMNDNAASVVTLAPGAISVVPNGLWLANDQDSIGGGWVSRDQLYGSMDEVRFYDRALSSDEVGQLYQIPEPLTISLVALGGLAVFRWRKNRN